LLTQIHFRSGCAGTVDVYELKFLHMIASIFFRSRLPDKETLDVI